MVLVAAAGRAEEILDALRSHPDGKNAARAGWFEEWETPGVVVESPYGGIRSLISPSGEQLPRIC